MVDDNATNRDILEQWLRDWQMERPRGRRTAWRPWTPSGTAAIGQPYALVLLDARMPDTDGLRLAAGSGNERRCLASGSSCSPRGTSRGTRHASGELRIDAHLLKPVLQDELLKTIYR